MRKICLLVIALALVSVTNQNLLSFGEFIEGHDAEPPKKFRVMSSSISALVKYAMTHRIYVIAKSRTNVELQSPCGSSTRTSNVKKSCSESANKAHEEAKTILFAKPDSTGSLITHGGKAPFPFKSSKGTLILSRSA